MTALISPRRVLRIVMHPGDLELTIYVPTLVCYHHPVNLQSNDMEINEIYYVG